MRIAVVTTVFPALSQTFVVDQICRLMDLGHEVDIFAMQEGDPSVTSDALRNYDLWSKLHTPAALPGRGIRRYLEIAALCARLSLYSPSAVARVLTNRTPSGIRRADALRHLIQFNGEGKYAAVLCHFGQVGLRMILLQRLGVNLGPIATVFHGADISRYVNHHGPSVFNSLFERGAIFLPVSAAWADRLRELGCPPEKIQVHRMGVDSDVHAPSAARKDESDMTRILSVCRLVEKKGIEYAIRAVAELKRREFAAPVRYTIIGDGPLLPYLQAIVREEQLEEVVEFAGAQPPEVVATHLTAADLLLAPSVTASDGDKEGIPVAIMEAMSREIPVLSTFHSGIPELIEDGKTGWLVPERDVSALSQKLSQILQTRRSWPSIGRAARERILTDHNNWTLARELEAILAGLHH